LRVISGAQADLPKKAKKAFKSEKAAREFFVHFEISLI
jgi:hypothetical protein